MSSEARTAAPAPAPFAGAEGSGSPATQDDLQVCRQNSTLRRQVEDRLRHAIFSGRFRPGQRLLERELCQILGVGRTSVREALRHLESEGLITSVPHRGLTVTRIHGEEIDQIYALRALVESYAAGRCAVLADAPTKERIEAAADAYGRAADRRDDGELVRAKAAFYALLVAAGGNAFVGQTLTSLHNRIGLLRVATLNEPGRLEASASEIRAIAGAIAAGDPEAASALCRIHVENAAAIAQKASMKNDID